MGPNRWADVMAACIQKMGDDDLARLLALSGLPAPESNAVELKDVLKWACGREDCPSLLSWIQRFSGAGQACMASVLIGTPKREHGGRPAWA